MDNFGYIRVAAYAPKMVVGNTVENFKSIAKCVMNAHDAKVDVAVFPELSITGATCGDLFLQQKLIVSAEQEVKNLCRLTENCDVMVVVGVPVSKYHKLFNCAVVVYKGQILGVVPKSYIPNREDNQEKRWFASGLNIAHESVEFCGGNYPFGTDLLFEYGGVRMAVEIGDDLSAVVPPSVLAATEGATIILNPSAESETVGKYEKIAHCIKHHSSKIISGYVYASAGCGESTTDVVYNGNCIVAESGNILKSSDRNLYDTKFAIADIDVEKIENKRRCSSVFCDHISSSNVSFRVVSANAAIHTKDDLKRHIDPHPFVPSNLEELHRRCEEIINIQTLGLMKRVEATRCQKLVIGISGGLDSTLALIIAVEAFKRMNIDLKGIYGITMPGFGTTNRTYDNACNMVKQMGATLEEISIKDAVIQHFNDINHNVNIHDVTYENSQARERTQILMDYANKVNGMVVGTGDLSELALGWCTFNGDQMSMYGVNAGVPKSLIRSIVAHYADCIGDDLLKNILTDVVNTPISPELIPADEIGNIKQKTEDLVGPYELHDFFIYHFLHNKFAPTKIYMLAKNAFVNEYSDEVIKHWLSTFMRRFFNQQFKRSAMPDGPKVGNITLSPRGGWVMPSDASSEIWLNECNHL